MPSANKSGAGRVSLGWAASTQGFQGNNSSFLWLWTASMVVSTGSAEKILLVLCSLLSQHVFPWKQRFSALSLHHPIFRVKIQIQCWVSALFSLFIISETLLFVSWMEFIVWDQTEDQLRFLYILVWNQIWIYCQRLKLSLIERISSQTLWCRDLIYFHLYLYSTEPSRVTTSTGVFEQHFKAINF